MIPVAQKLLERAQKGERLVTKERRHCIAYLMVTAPEWTNAQMGELFGVSERQIRLDKRYIKEERAKLIKEEDIALVIADIAMSFENQVRDIEASKAKCEKGGRTYLEHCKAIFDLQLKKVKALQDLGYYPKNLGNMTIDKFEYKAVVSKDGSVDTRPVDLVIEQQNEEIIEAEFEEKDCKALSAPSVDSTETARDAGEEKT